MFRLWGKMWKDNHMLKDIVIDDDSEDTRTHKIFRALQEICYDFDLENPIWLDSNVAVLNAMPEPDSARTVLLSILNLIIWRFKSSKKIDKTDRFASR